MKNYLWSIKLNNQVLSILNLVKLSVGKDTMTGHWEIMGLNIMQPFKVYPNGFPDELIQEIEEMTGRKVVANKPA